MNTLHPKRHARLLLVLDGQALDRAMLDTVLHACVPHSPRLDILLHNPPREPTSRLAMLLLRLEHSGVDYRMASSHGDLSEEVMRYLGRNRGIGSIAFTDPALLSDEVRSLIERGGCEILGLADAGK